MIVEPPYVIEPLSAPIVYGLFDHALKNYFSLMIKIVSISNQSIIFIYATIEAELNHCVRWPAFINETYGYVR